jgi:hypothetical protein
MSTVVPMKGYEYDRWAMIVFVNNLLRADKGHRPWPEEDCKQLWRDVFDRG